MKNFKCIRCGNCCRQEGYVRLKEADILQIASFLKMDPYDFTHAYTILTQDRQALSLKDKPNGDCIFLSSTGCRINDAKPMQCRTFPLQWQFSEFARICGWAKLQSLPRADQSPRISRPSSSSK